MLLVFYHMILFLCFVYKTIYLEFNTSGQNITIDLLYKFLEVSHGSFHVKYITKNNIVNYHFYIV